MSEINVNKVAPSTGTNVTLGDASDTFKVPSGVTLDIESGATLDVTGATVSGLTSTTINNNADNRVITGSGTANTLNGESGLLFDGTKLGIGVTPTLALDISSTDPRIYMIDTTSAGSTYKTKFGQYNDTFLISTNDGANDAIKIYANGEVIKPLQPTFIVKASSQLNVTGNGTSYNVIFDSEIKDVGNNFSGTTFTAPITGSYILTCHVDFNGGNNNVTDTYLQFESSNRDFKVYTIKGGAGGGTGTQAGILYGTGDGQGMGLSGSCIADMDANDTVYLRLTVNGAGSDQCDIKANNTMFSGTLIC